MADNRASYRLTNLDASFLYQESAVSQMHGGMIFFLSGGLSFDEFFRHVEGRLHTSPRYRQRLAFPPFNLAHPTLEDDPDFKLERHVQHRQLAAGSDQAGALQEILRYNNSRVLDRNHPLWNLTLFEGLPERSFIMFEMHHALVDGVSGFDLINKLMDFTPNATPAAPAAPAFQAPPSLPGTGETYLRALRDLLVEQIDSATRATLEFVRDPMGAIRRAQELTSSMRLINESLQTPAVATPWNSGGITEERGAAWLKLPLADFRAIRNAFGGTINDVIITLLGEGAARYLKDHGWPTDGKLRIGCPVNVRRPDEQITLENRVSIMMPTTPAGPMDVIERLRAISAETRRIKEARLPHAMEQMISTNPMPSAWAAAMGRMTAQQMVATAQFIKATNWKPNPAGPHTPVAGINFMATNVPGPQTPWYLAGHEITGLFCAVPLAGNLGLGVVITSYNHQLFISFVADPHLLPDLARLKDFVQAAFSDLCERLPRETIEYRDNKNGVLAAV